MTMTLVSSIQVGAGGASVIDFTNISQLGTDLVIMYGSRPNGTYTSNSYDVMRFNGGGTYNAVSLEGSGSGVSSRKSAFTGSGYGPLVANQKSTDTANTFSSATIYIPNYTGSQNKTWSSDGVTENNATAAFQWLIAADSNVTAAITSIRILPPSGLAEGSFASLYTITKGSGGATVS